MPEFTQYEHHNHWVSVREDLKGKHRAHCLCEDCAWFRPLNYAANCLKANLVYAVCQAHSMVLPVWECPDFFAQKDEQEPGPE